MRSGYQLPAVTLAAMSTVWRMRTAFALPIATRAHASAVSFGTGNASMTNRPPCSGCGDGHACKMKQSPAAASVSDAALPNRKRTRPAGASGSGFVVLQGVQGARCNPKGPVAGCTPPDGARWGDKTPPSCTHPVRPGASAGASGLHPSGIPLFSRFPFMGCKWGASSMRPRQPRGLSQSTPIASPALLGFRPARRIRALAAS